ncbi:hypothetical protein CHUAL_007273 [Chamberlinius hualienensis]
MSILIGGGTGFIGTALVRLLRRKGYNVTVISRNPGLNRITWTDLEKSGLTQNYEAVINLAGQNLMDPTRRWTPGFKQNVWASRVNTTKALAQAIREAKTPPKVFATISGVACYQPSPTLEYTEESFIIAFDFLSQLVKDWEDATTDAQNVRRVIIRTGAVLGREGGIVKNLIWPFFLGLGGPVGSGNQWMPWVHVRDLINLFTYAIENDSVSGVLNGVAPQAVTNGEFAKCFAHQMWRPAIIPLPVFMANLAFGEERAKVLTEGQKVIPKRTLECGFNYQYPDLKSACEEFARLIYADSPAYFQ